MRLVQITISSGKRDRLLRKLDEQGLEYMVSEETSGREFDVIVYIPLPTSAVEPTLNTLKDAGLESGSITVVLEANTILAPKFAELEEKYDEEEDMDRIAQVELESAASELAPSLNIYAILTIVSAVVATAGLLLNSAAVVVGSMVIAPLIGPAMSASVGTVLGNREMFLRGVKLQILGLLLSIGSAFLFAFMVRQVHLIPPLADVTTIPEIRERVAPDFLTLAIAIGAGIAGIISLTTGVSAALVGVMIAVALIPPAATAGIGLAWGQPMVSLNSGVLLLVNVLSINMAALVVLWYKGYRPEHWFRTDAAKKSTIKRVGTLAVAILLLSAFLGGVTYDSYQRATVEESIHDDVELLVEAYDEEVEISLVDVEVIYPHSLPFQEADRVIVTVSIPPGETVSGLASDIRTLVHQNTGNDIPTEVIYINAEVSNPG